MNRYHRRCCRSPGWSAFMAGTVLPHALDGIDLGPRVLELGPGYGASTRPLAARARSLTVLEYDPLLAARLRTELGSVRNRGPVRPLIVKIAKLMPRARPGLANRVARFAGDRCIDPCRAREPERVLQQLSSVQVLEPFMARAEVFGQLLTSW